MFLPKSVNLFKVAFYSIKSVLSLMVSLQFFIQINAGVPQGSVLAKSLFPLHITKFVSSISNPVSSSPSYPNDNTLHSSIELPKRRKINLMACAVEDIFPSCMIFSPFAHYLAKCPTLMIGSLWMEQSCRTTTTTTTTLIVTSSST